MTKQRILVLFLLLVLCCSIAVFALDTEDASDHFEDSPAPASESEKATHRATLTQLQKQQVEDGWIAVSHHLCTHGGAITYNDLTLQRTVDSVTETRYFCPWLMHDFQP